MVLLLGAIIFAVWCHYMVLILQVLDALKALGLRCEIVLETLLDAARSLEGLTEVTEMDVDRASLLLEKLNDVAAQGVPLSFPSTISGRQDAFIAQETHMHGI